MALRMHKQRTLTVMAGAVAVALVASACGGGDKTTSGSSARSRHPRTDHLRPGQGQQQPARPAGREVERQAPRPRRSRIKEQSDKADQQHDDLVQHFQAKDPSYDVVSVDVVWTAEFAAKGWLTPLKDKLALPTDRVPRADDQGRDLQQDALRGPDVLATARCSTTAATW